MRLPMFSWAEEFGLPPHYGYALQVAAVHAHTVAFGRPPAIETCPCGDCDETHHVFDESFATVVIDGYQMLIGAAELHAENDSKRRHPSGGAR